MDLKNFSVDDILDDIKIKNAEIKNEPLSNMQQVDEMIRDILTKKQGEQLKQENRSVSLREKKEMEDEIKLQSQNLTEQFKKLQKTEDYRKPPEPVEHSELGNTAQIKLASIHKEQKVKYRDTSEIPIPKGLQEKKEQKYQELKKSANNQHIAQDMRDITSHFGNFKINDASLDESYAKAEGTNITKENYKEFKSNRNKKVDGFVIEHKKQHEKAVTPPTQGAEQELSMGEELSRKRAEKVKQFALPEQEQLQSEYEYNDKSQTKEIASNLAATKKSAKSSLLLLAVLSILSILLIFTKTDPEGMLLLHKILVSPGVYSLINMGILLVAMLCSLSIFVNTIASLAEQKPDKDLLYSLMMIVCFVANVVFCIKPEGLLVAGAALYTPIAIILLFFNLLEKSFAIKRIIKNFSFLSNEAEKYALVEVSDPKNAREMTRGVVEGEPVLVKNVKTNFFENFLANSFKPDLSDILARKIAIFSIPAALLLGAIGYLFAGNITVCVTLASGTMLMLTGIIGSMIVTFPLHDTADVVSHFSGMIPDYHTIENYKDTDAILIDANDLFPENAVVLRGIKTFQGKRVDNAIIDAASVLCAANSVLQGVFLAVINHKTELLKEVDSVIYEDLMGISGWVDQKRVLIGNRDLMINHSIAVPKAEYEIKYHQEGNEVVFLACGGELCAAFILEFKAEGTPSDVAQLLHKNDIIAVIKTVDACITGEMLQRVFEVDSGLFKIIPARLHRNFDLELQPVEKVDSMLGNKGQLFGHIVSIVACKKLAACTKLGGMMYMISAVCGILLLLALLVLDKFSIMGNLQMFLYMASFGVVYWIYEKNIKL